MFKVPQKTSVWTKRPQNSKDEIYFPKELINLVLSGQKIQTFRFGNKYDHLQCGDIVSIKQNGNDQELAKAKIVSIAHQIFKELPFEGFENKEHQRKVLSGYYAFLGREIQDDDPFIILDFELI